MARRYRARDRTVNKITRDGLVEENLNSKETRRVSRRESDNALITSASSTEADYPHVRDQAGNGRKKRRSHKKRRHSAHRSAYADPQYPPEEAAYSFQGYPSEEMPHTEQHYQESELPYTEQSLSAEEERNKHKKARNKAAVYASYAKEAEQAESKADYSEARQNSDEPKTAEHGENFSVTDRPEVLQTSPDPVIVEAHPASYEYSKRSEKLKNNTRRKSDRTTSFAARRGRLSRRRLRVDRHRSDKLDHSQTCQAPSKLTVVSGKNKAFRRYVPTHMSDFGTDDSDSSQTDDTVQELYGTTIKAGGDVIRIVAGNKTKSPKHRNFFREEPPKRGESAGYATVRYDSSRAKKTYSRLHERRKAEKMVEPEALFSGKKAKNRRIQKKLRKRKYQKVYRDAFLAGTGILDIPMGRKDFMKANGKFSVTKGGRKSLISMVAIGLRKNKATAVASFLICVVLFMSILSFTGMIFEGVLTAIAATTYQSTDEDIHDVEDAYKKLENALDAQINGMEQTHPGYDEYRYQVDEISHNPFHLISYLTVLYGEFTLDDVRTALSEIFEAQYTLTVWEEVETRTRTVTDPDTGEGTEEEYDYYILNISLTNRGINAVARDTLTDEQYQLYVVYNSTLGNRPDLFDESMIPIGIDPESGYAYVIPPEALSDEKFARMYEEASKYLGYPYVWGGSSPQTSFDCSGFVSWVINHCGNGWNVGRSTAEGLRGYCSYVSRDEAKPGDLIFFQGTYNTSGASHVGIVVGDGKMIHCGDPIQVTSYLTPYWQQHFYQIGRLP